MHLNHLRELWMGDSIPNLRRTATAIVFRIVNRILTHFGSHLRSLRAFVAGNGFRSGLLNVIKTQRGRHSHLTALSMLGDNRCYGNS